VSLPLRDYQREAIEAIDEAHAEGTTKPAVVWATGLGKTVLFAKAAERFHAKTGLRVLALAHRRELVAHAEEDLRSVAPGLSTGIVMGSRNQTLASVVCASPQTLAHESRRRQLLNVGLVIADECHHYAAPTFRKVLDHFTEQGALALGVTATLSRGDGLSLGKVWDKVVHTKDIAFGVANGWLVRPRGVRVRVDDLDLRTVRRNRATGDYDVDALGAAVIDSMAPKRIAEAILEHAQGRKTVVFAPNVESTEVIAEALQAAGIVAAPVHYKIPDALRDERLKRHTDELDPLQVLVNPMILTEGWNNPACSVAVIARKTSNNGLYIQMIGRVLRPSPGKRDALIIDVCGAAERNTLQAQIDLFGEEPEEIERDPCLCVPGGDMVCTCRRGKCTEDCHCGGRPCACVWPEMTELEVSEATHDAYADGRLVVEEIDLFHGSRNLWQTTYGGTHFITAGADWYIAITPGRVPGMWDVVRMHKYEQGNSRFVQRDQSDLGFAQAWAEQDVRPEELNFARKGTSWRKDVAKPNQLQLARRYGLPVHESMSRGEVSSMIDIYTASWRMDATAAMLRERQHAGAMA
jgi:superfamily II DNA or RNA helicase